MTDNEIIRWLLEGDVSIQFQVYRDLLNTDKNQLRKRIESEGWGARFLSFRSENGHWGRGFYQPKWTSTHYTLLDFKNLGISPQCHEARQSVELVLKEEKGPDGGINPSRTIKNSDVCLNGMVLNYAAYFRADQGDLKSIVDFLLSEQMSDGGFNCHSNRYGAVHSSLHTTLSVAEGILEYAKNGYDYRLAELEKAEHQCREFMLQHHLFKSDRTGQIIKKQFLMLSYPSRWRYDILRALDYFRYARVDYDSRLDEAIFVLLKKRMKDQRWPLQARHAGKTHFKMEEPGQPSRWNTLRALRVLNHFRLRSRRG